MDLTAHGARHPAVGPLRSSDPGSVIRSAIGLGLVIGRQVKIGIVRGVIIGYNIARRGRYRGMRFPLLIKTELGIAKCSLEEVAPT